MEVAKFQGENSAYRSFDWSYQMEKKHLELFQRAKDAVAGSRDMDLDAVQVCEVCGYTLEGEAPDYCPVCKAEKSKFKAFD